MAAPSAGFRGSWQRPSTVMSRAGSIAPKVPRRRRPGDARRRRAGGVLEAIGTEIEMVMLTPGGEEFLLQSWAMSPGFAPTKDQTATAPSSPTLTAHFWSGEMRTAFTAFEWATPSAVATPSS